MSARDVLATAYQTEHGIQAECPTTHESFVGGSPRIISFSGHRAVAMKCTCCDAQLRTGEDYDSKEPQWHVYFYQEHE